MKTYQTTDKHTKIYIFLIVVTYIWSCKVDLHQSIVENTPILESHVHHFRINIKMVFFWFHFYKLSRIGEGQRLTDRPKNIAHNYLLLFSLVYSPSNILHVHTSAPRKSNKSNLTSNQHNPYFRYAVALPKYHTAVVHAHSSHSFTSSIEH